MKYDVTPTPVFPPIQITITIENAEELRSLWHRFNIVHNSLSPDYVDGYNDCDSLKNPKMFSGIWGEIEQLCVKHGVSD